MSPLIVGSNSEGSEGRSDRLGLPVGTSDPGTAEAGDLYYKTDTNKIRYYDGTQWNDLAAGGGGGDGGGGGGGGSTAFVTNSVRFNSADEAYLTRNISSDITTFTLSMWVKRHGSARDDIFVTDSGTGFFFYFDTNGKLKINTNSGNIFESTGAYNDHSAWYHICINNNGTTFNLYVNGVLDKSVTVSTALTNGAMLIGRDRLSNPANHSDINLAEVHFVDGQALDQTEFGEFDTTTGIWNPKEVSLTYGGAGFHLDFVDGAIDSSSNTNNFTVSGMDIRGADATITSFTGDNGNATSGVTTIAGPTSNNYSTYAFINFANNSGQHIFYHQADNGTSTWFFSDSGHSYQTTHSTEQGGNTSGYRNNGSEYNDHLSTFGSFATANGTTSGYVNSPSASDPGGPGGINGGTATGLNTTNAGNIWKFVVDTTYNKVWIDPGTGSFAGGGDPSNVSSTATLQLPDADIKFWSIPYANGNTNDIFSAADLFVDSCQNGTASTGADPGGSVVGNYATMNPLDEQFTDNGSFSEGNLKYVQSATGARACRATMGVSSGKWYWEYEHLGGNASHGIQKASSDLGSFPGGSDADGISWFVGGNIYRDGSTSTYSGTTFAVGDCIGTALDLDNGTLVFYKNGVSQGIAATDLTGEWFPAFGSSNVSNVSVLANFGQKKFKYPAPTDFKSLCSTNLPTPAISKGSSYVDAKPYDGTGNSNPQTLGFTPDFLIIKRRDGANAAGVVLDSIRGATKALETSNATGEKTNDPAIGSFDAGGNDGFTLTGTYGQTNNNGTKYAAWAWDAGETTNSISAGGLNTSAYNQDYTWSDSLTSSSGFRGPEPATNAFDGSTGTVASAIDNGTITFTSPVAVPKDSTIRVWVNGGNHNCTVNGGVEQNISAGLWQDLEYTNFSNSTFVLTVQRDTTADTGLRAVQIGGRILVNTNVSPSTNYPSIATSYRATTTSGCSVVSYSGVDTPSTNTVAHGLDKAPELYIIKNRTTTSAQGWIANTTVFDGSVDWMILNTNAAKADQGDPWYTRPTPYYFTLGANDNNTCDAGNDYIAYCFHSVEGFSRIGSFNNNDGEGSFVYCGFKPRIIIAKNAIDLGGQTGVGDWMIYDTARNPFNGTGDQNTLVLNEPNQEDGFYTSTQATIDILSNGFKIKHFGSSPLGDSNRQFWFAAWAENPFALNSRAS